MKLADENVTGKLISDPGRRASWLQLVRALQVASTSQDGPLAGWVFHGTDEYAADNIAVVGLTPAAAMVSVTPGQWDNDARGVHFGTANLSAFFAEDRIEALDDASIELAIFGVPLESLTQCGELAADGQMVDCPVYTRIDAGTAADAQWAESPQDWRSSLETLGSVVVLGHVPAALLKQFRSIDDLRVILSDNVALDSPQRVKVRRPSAP